MNIDAIRAPAARATRAGGETVKRAPNVCCVLCAQRTRTGRRATGCDDVSELFVQCSQGMPCQRAERCHYSFGAEVPGCAPCAQFNGWPVEEHGA